MIERTTEAHKVPLLKIISNSGQFDADGLEHVESTLDSHFENPDEAIWLTALDDEPVGVAYCSPEPVTSGTWNLLMLWLKEGFEGKGLGKALVVEVEKELKKRDARLLIVETSQLPEFEAARAFYANYGFKLEAEVANFFEHGDNKLIYTKSLNES